MYFSLYVERKVPKERHLRKKPTVSSLGNHHPKQRGSFAGGLKSLTAHISRKDPNTRTNGRVPSARKQPI